MKMMPKSDCVFCHNYLMWAKHQLEDCLKRMKGKYGTSGAVKDIKCAIKDIERVLFYESKFKYLNKFWTPPNTPKSRRLGWHKGRVSNCDRESVGYCTYYGKPCHKKIRNGFRCGGYEWEGATNEQ